MCSKPLVVSLAWGPTWQEKADRLEASAKIRGYDVEVIRPQGVPDSRQQAWSVRPCMILVALEGGRPVLAIDADAVIQRRLDRITSITAEEGYDFAAVRHNDEFWRLGVLWVAPTRRARQVLMEFARRMTERRLQFDNDEPLFARVVGDLRARVCDLPPEYNWCEAWNDRANRGNRLPVIEVNA
jgi:hypothetical protein